MKEPTKRFSSRVENYLKYRPHYPVEALDILAEGCGLTTEWVVLNGEGKALDIEGLKTDARQLYLDLRQGQPQRFVILGGRSLTQAGKDIYRQENRGDSGK